MGCKVHPAQREMCKTPIRELQTSRPASAMLMRSELPKQLLFNALEGMFRSRVKPVMNIRFEVNSNQPAIPQAFPQIHGSVQVQLVKVFTVDNYRNHCTVRGLLFGG